MTNCNEVSKRYAIPVTVNYSDFADTIRLNVTGLGYPFSNKHLRNSSQGNGINELTFVVFDIADGQQNDFSVTVDLIGGNCNTIISATETYSFIAPTDCLGTVPTCQDSLILSGIITTDNTFEASDFIKTTQVFDSLAVNTIGATNFVTLNAGFHAKAGTTLTINNSGCTN